MSNELTTLAHDKAALIERLETALVRSFESGCATVHVNTAIALLLHLHGTDDAEALVKRLHADMRAATWEHRRRLGYRDLDVRPRSA